MRAGRPVPGVGADRPGGAHRAGGRAVGRGAPVARAVGVAGGGDAPGVGGLLPDLRLLDAAELPAGFSSGWSYTAPAVSMPVYLEYLLNRYAAAAGASSTRR